MSTGLLRTTDASSRLLCRHWIRRSSHASVTSASDAAPVQGKSLADLSEGLVGAKSKKKGKGRRKVEGESVAQNSKVFNYLAEIASTKGSVVLEDIERHKPRTRFDPRYPSYDEKYNQVFQTLVQSFTVAQFREFFDLYGLPIPITRLRTKDIFAERILKHWGWEALEKVQEDRADMAQTSEQLFPLDRATSFLLMGKDGGDIVSLSKRYNVHLSFTSNPLALKVQGLKGSVKQIAGYLKSFKSDLLSVTTSLPLVQHLDSESAQSVSRICGAYVEMEDDGKLRITYRKIYPEVVESVRRMAVQAVSEQIDTSSAQIICSSRNTQTDPDASSYSLYPFFPSQITSRMLSSTSSFRLRQVGQWLRTNVPFTLDENEETPLLDRLNAEVKSDLLSKLSKVQLKTPSMVLTATAGHLLFQSEETSLVPPVTGSTSGDAILQWSKDHSDRVIFNPSVPKALLNSWPQKQRELLRIIYKAHQQEGEAVVDDGVRRIFIIEVPGGHQDGQGTFMEPSCTWGAEASVDVLIPERSTDIHITTSSLESLRADDTPEEIKEYISRVQADSSTGLSKIPLMFVLDGVHYILSLSANIQQSYHKVTLPETGAASEVIVETTANPETGENIMVCKVVSESVEADSGWSEFLARCEDLSRLDDDVQTASSQSQFGDIAEEKVKWF